MTKRDGDESTASDQAGDYEVAVLGGAEPVVQHRGLSHAAAMTAAEDIQRSGQRAVVMHVTAAGRYEVDR